ncbi:MAG: hypothetical protein J6C44_07810 [Muribaculaceae bacterium]|nr:hypothetical protein [Muribaculaceae bacterium]
MNRLKRLIIPLIALITTISGQSWASSPSDTTSTTLSNEATTIAPQERPLRFTWGADIGASVDMTGHDMSALGIGAMFGMEWKWIRFIGVGAEADVMVSNSSRTFPLSLIFRTDFSQHRRLLFMDLRGGVAPSYLDHDRQETVPYLSGGMGITLAAGHKFSSHLTLSYTYLGQKECYNGDYLRDCPGIGFIQLRLGIAF